MVKCPQLHSNYIWIKYCCSGHQRRRINDTLTFCVVLILDRLYYCVFKPTLLDCSFIDVLCVFHCFSHFPLIYSSCCTPGCLRRGDLSLDGLSFSFFLSSLTILRFVELFLSRLPESSGWFRDRCRATLWCWTVQLHLTKVWERIQRWQ